MPISQVLLSDTFGQFRNAFNDTANAVNSVVSTSGNIVTGNIVGSTLSANNLTSGRLTLATTAGQLTDDSALTYDTSTDILTLAGTTDASSSTTGTLKVAGGVGVAKKLFVGTDLNVGGNSVFTGNVSFLGSNTLISTTVVNIEDNILQLSHLNPSDVVDIGFIGGYNNGANVHSGIFRDATDGKWKLFKDYTAEPTSVIDTAANGFAYADLVINGLETNNNISVATGKAYQINSANVLSSTTLGSTVINSSLTSVGTIGTGVWQGTVINSTYGGTGVNNAGRTITIGGNLTTAGAFNTTVTATANTSVTLPTSGTLVGSADTATVTNLMLANNSLTIGSTNVALGATSTSLTGLTSVSTAALTASGNVSFTSTGALKIPSGTTAENAGYATVGMLRYDTTKDRLEIYKSTGWAAAGGGVSASKLYFYGNF